MSYLFSDEGYLADDFNDKDDRVFVLKGLRQCIDYKIVQPALRQLFPTTIGTFPILLVIKEPRLREFAATVYSEVGATHNSSEAEGIARVIRNRAEHLGAHYGDADFFRRVGATAMFGRGTANFVTANALRIDSWTGNMKSDLEACVRSLVAAGDVTNGSYFWEGTALLLNPRHPWRQQNWVGGNDPHYRGTTLAGTYTPAFIWRADLGQTSFFAYNPAGSGARNVWP
jgi:hypothetical protein